MLYTLHYYTVRVCLYIYTRATVIMHHKFQSFCTTALLLDKNVFKVCRCSEVCWFFSLESSISCTSLQTFTNVSRHHIVENAIKEKMSWECTYIWGKFKLTFYITVISKCRVLEQSDPAHLKPCDSTEVQEAGEGEVMTAYLMVSLSLGSFLTKHYTVVWMFVIAVAHWIYMNCFISLVFLS